MESRTSSSKSHRLVVPWYGVRGIVESKGYGLESSWVVMALLYFNGYDDIPTPESEDL